MNKVQCSKFSVHSRKNKQNLSMYFKRTFLIMCSVCVIECVHFYGGGGEEVGCNLIHLQLNVSVSVWWEKQGYCGRILLLALVIVESSFCWLSMTWPLFSVLKILLAY